MSTSKAKAGRPAFSVIMPVANGRDDAICSINSILSQTCQDFEILVVDDGIDNETEQIVHLFRDDRIHYLPREETNINNIAWNIGVAQAGGAYITHLAPGNILKPDCLERILEETEKFPEEFIFIISRHGTQSERASFYHHAARTLTPPEYQSVLLHYQLEPTPCGVFYKRSTLSETPAFAEALRHIDDKDRVLSFCDDYGCVLLTEPLWQNTLLDNTGASHHPGYDASPARIHEYYISIQNQQRASLNYLLFRSVLRHIARADLRGLHHDIKLFRSRNHLSGGLWFSLRNYVYGIATGKNSDKRKEQRLDML